MKKLMMLLLSLMFWTNAFSEDSISVNIKEKHKFAVYGCIEGTASLRQHGLAPNFMFATLEFEPLNKFSFALSYVGFLGLYKEKETKTYYTSQGLAGSLALQIYKAKTDTFCFSKGGSINAQIRYGHNVGGGDFKFDLYDVGFVSFGKERKMFGNSFSLGYRYIKSHTAGIRNYNGVYLGIGI